MLWSSEILNECENCALVGEDNCFEHSRNVASFEMIEDNLLDFGSVPIEKSGHRVEMQGQVDQLLHQLENIQQQLQSHSNQDMEIISTVNSYDNLNSSTEIQSKIYHLQTQITEVIQVQQHQQQQKQQLQQQEQQLQQENLKQIQQVQQQQQQVQQQQLQQQQIVLHSSQTRFIDSPESTEADPNSFMIQCVVFDSALQQEREKTIVNTSFSSGSSMTLMSSFKRKPFASLSKWFQNTTDQMSFVCAVSNNLLQGDFNISKLGMSIPISLFVFFQSNLDSC
jgi:hypothetical protein